MATSAATSSLLRLSARGKLLLRALPASLPLPFTDALHTGRKRQNHARRCSVALGKRTCPA